MTNYIKRHVNYFNEDSETSGYKYTVYTVYRRSVFEALTDIDIEQLYLHAYSEGTGRFFREAAFIRQRKNYVIIVQRFGYDC